MRTSVLPGEVLSDDLLMLGPGHTQRRPSGLRAIVAMLSARAINGTAMNRDAPSAVAMIPTGAAAETASAAHRGTNARRSSMRPVTTDVMAQVMTE